MSSPSIIGRFKDWVNETSSYSNYYSTISTDNVEYMLSFDHSKSFSRGKFRDGDQFILWKNQWNRDPSDPSPAFRYGKWKVPEYEGSFVTPVPDAIPVPSAASLESYGPTAYRRMRPDNPIMSLPNALYELKDVPEMLKQAFEIKRKFQGREFALRDIHSYNLGILFGWLPLLSDVNSLFNNQEKVAKQVKYILKNNGRPVNRRIEFRDETRDDLQTVAEYDTSFPELFPILVTQSYAGGGHTKITHRTETKLWASGQFRFWFDDLDHLTDTQKASAVRTMLYGISQNGPSPSQIYKAIPWSWLIDWFTNLGDNVANLQSDMGDRLVCDYLYLMRTRKTTVTQTVTGSIWSAEGIRKDISSSTSTVNKRLERVVGSPFGLYAKHSDLSPFQQAIAVSLLGSGGLSRKGI